MEKKCKYCATMIPKAAKICPHCRKTQGWTLPAKIFAGFFVLFVIYPAIKSGNYSSTSTSTSNQPNPSDVKRQVKEQVKIKKLNWNKGGFDNIMMIDATFENKSNKDIKDIEVTCNHFSNSGTKIDSNSKVIYETIKAGKSKSVRNFNMGFIHSQAASTNCSISDLVVQ